MAISQLLLSSSPDEMLVAVVGFVQCTWGESTHYCCGGFCTVYHRQIFKS